VKIVAAISRKKMLMNVKNAGLFSALSVSAKVARTNSKTTMRPAEARGRPRTTNFNANLNRVFLPLRWLVGRRGGSES
jgi:hypothetical protein